MSEVDTAPEGAEVAPVENVQDVSPQPTGEQEAPKDDKPRDEKGRFVPQERVNEITRARREAERRLEAAERELAYMRQQQPAPKPSPQASTDKPPSFEDFDFDMAKWAEAAADYAARHAVTVAEQRFQQQEAQRKHQSVASQFEERAQEFSKTHPDFDQALSDLGRAVQFSPEIVEAVASSDIGPAVVYHLAQHLDEADRLARMSPMAAAMQLGRLEAQLSAPKAKPVTNAPAPAPVLSGGGKVNRNPDDMPINEWLAWRREQLKK